MFDKPVLFQQFGVAWTLAKCCGVLGGLLLLVGGVLFAILIKHTGTKSYRLTPEEVGQMASEVLRGEDDPPEGVPYFRQWGAKGVGIKLTFTIGSLRAAARRQDWLTFWGAPACFFSWFVGLWLVFMCIMLAASFPLSLRIAFSVVMGLTVAVVLFMPWAAIYTNIEADTDTPPAQGPVTGPRGAPGGPPAPR